ncbi:hypothetical protein MIR68_006539 [Amoeboaphelidium protococcarum]|nr:hypothetical protein MIR68_006539 [Amoeboaphelidium protococcarum]
MTVQDISSSLQFSKLINSKPVAVIDFAAEWCGPCKMIAPKFHSMATQYSGAAFGRVDVDMESALAQQYSVTAMPTFVLFKNGKQADTVVGADIGQVEQKLKRLLASAGSSSLNQTTSTGYVLGSGKKVTANAMPTDPRAFFQNMDESRQQLMILLGFVVALTLYYFMSKQ